MTRMKRYLTIGLATLLAASMSSCILDPDPLPEMPYRPRKVTEPAPQPAEQPIEPMSWEKAPMASEFITPAETQSAPQPREQQVKTPATPAPNPGPPSITESSAPEPETAKNQPAPQPQVIQLPTVSPSSSTEGSKPETPAAATVDLKQITNTGPIPTAVRVEGDPTRVWNPLDPSKKIRIIDSKTNQPYPSGKKLKVRGTNFQFYVP